MSASPSAQTLKLRALTSDLATMRRENKAAIRTLPAVVAATRRVVDDAREDLRRRIEQQRTGGLTRSVIVLDDDADLRALMAHTLEIALHVPVYQAEDGDHAIDLFTEHRAAVLVSDLFLADGETGESAIRRVRRHGHHAVRAVLVSGLADLVTLTTAAGQCNAEPLPRVDLARLPAVVAELLDAVHPPLWCRASTDVLIEVSPALAAMLGETPDALAGQSWRSRVHPDDLARSEAERARRMGMGVEGFRQRMRCADGSYVTLEWDVTPATDGVVYAVARRVA